MNSIVVKDINNPIVKHETSPRMGEIVMVLEGKPIEPGNYILFAERVDDDIGASLCMIENVVHESCGLYTVHISDITEFDNNKWTMHNNPKVYMSGNEWDKLRVRAERGMVRVRQLDFWARHLREGARSLGYGNNISKDKSGGMHTATIYHTVMKKLPEDSEPTYHLDSILKGTGRDEYEAYINLLDLLDIDWRELLYNDHT